MNLLVRTVFSLIGLGYGVLLAAFVAPWRRKNRTPKGRAVMLLAAALVATIFLIMYVITSLLTLAATLFVATGIGFSGELVRRDRS